MSAPRYYSGSNSSFRDSNLIRENCNYNFLELRLGDIWRFEFSGYVFIAGSDEIKYTVSKFESRPDRFKVF